MGVIERVFRAIAEYFRKTDKWLMLICLLLSASSVYFLNGIYISKMVSGNSRAVTQAVAAMIGIVVATVISIVDYNTLVKLWKLYLPLCIIGVVLTFFVGVERGSNQAWLSIPVMGRSISVQPSEFLKISFITTFSLHISYVKDELNRLSNFLLLCLHGGAHVLLIVIQRDDGTAIVFMGIFIIMMFLAGLSWKYILPGLAMIGPALLVVWKHVMSLDQQMRFRVLFDPSVSEKYAYQQLQGLKALGVGGITGIGFHGDMVYVPESYNDFIFTFIGQTAGLVGCALVIIILIVLCCRLIYNGHMAQNTLGQMICYGVMAMVFIQSVMNIGMCINLLPVIGVPLPFLSAGGTSVVALYIGMGLVASVHRHKKRGLFD